MIFVVPLLPIAIAVFVLGFAVFGEISEHLTTIATVITVLEIVSFLFIVVCIIMSNGGVLRKVFGCIVTPPLCALSILITSFFIGELAQIEFSILGTVEFFFVLFVGGGICLMMVFGCLYAASWFSDY